jgi:hypothetical protein
MKRITIPITGNLDNIKIKIKEDQGIDMSYAQTVDFLIHFYKKHSGMTNPITQWRGK